MPAVETDMDTMQRNLGEALEAATIDVRRLGRSYSDFDRMPDAKS
jgi:hypothetical protein